MTWFRRNRRLGAAATSEPSETWPPEPKELTATFWAWAHTLSLQEEDDLTARMLPFHVTVFHYARLGATIPGIDGSVSVTVHGPTVLHILAARRHLAGLGYDIFQEGDPWARS